MAHDDAANIVSNYPKPLTWLENLPYVPKKEVGNSVVLFKNLYAPDYSFLNGQDITAWDLDRFVETVRQENGWNNETKTVYSFAWLNLLLTSFQAGEVTNYLSGEVSFNQSDNDWKPLYEAINAESGVKYFLYNDLKNFSFRDFVSGLPKTGLNEKIFFDKLEEYLTVTATIRENTFPSTANVPSYEGLYKQFFGNDDQGFKDLLKEIFIYPSSGDYSQTIWHKVFIPSQLFNHWAKAVKDKYLETHNISFVDQRDPTDVDIIERILRLLSKMVGTLQRVSAAQAGRLSFYANWQRAYTKLLEDVPILTARMTSTDPNAAWTSESLTSLQGSASNIQQQLRAYRDQVKDEAKQLQTSLNQSTEASNQQVNIASGILQQLSTILSQIFR